MHSSFYPNTLLAMHNFVVYVQTGTSFLHMDMYVCMYVCMFKQEHRFFMWICMYVCSNRNIVSSCGKKTACSIVCKYIYIYTSVNHFFSRPKVRFACLSKNWKFLEKQMNPLRGNTYRSTWRNDVPFWTYIHTYIHTLRKCA